MKLLFLVPSVEAGGAEKNIIELANHFSNLENTTVILCAVNKSGAFENRINSSVHFINLNSKKVSRSVFKLMKLIMFKKPNIVFSTLPHLNILSILLVNFMKIFDKKIKIIVRETSLPESRGKIKWNMKLGYLFVYRFADKIIAQSIDMRNQLISLTKSSKINIINNSVDIKQIVKQSNEIIDTNNNLLRSNEKNKLILMIGRLEKIKGHLRTIEFLNDNFKFNYQLMIIGNGSEKNKIKQKVNELNLEGNIYFLDHVKNPYAYISKADLLISGSYVEGFPNVILESISLETPFIIIDQIGGGNDIVSKLNMQYRHIKKSSDWNEKLFSNDDLIMNYKKFERNYDKSIIYKKYEEMFNELLI